MTTYREFHRRSIEQPEAFWGDQAALIDWHKPFTKVLDYSRPPFARWFVGGETNLCHNAVDRHLKDRADQRAEYARLLGELGRPTDAIRQFLHLAREAAGKGDGESALEWAREALAIDTESASIVPLTFTPLSLIAS